MTGPCPEAHDRVVVRGGIRWKVQVAGSGPAMLLVHGTGASSHSFRDLVPLLSTRFTVIAPDLPGHAFSTAPASFEPSLPGMAAALGELLEALEVAPRVAVGHSAGAAVLGRMTLDGIVRPRLLVGLAGALVPFRGVARAVLPRTARLLAAASKVIDFRPGAKVNMERLLKSTGSSLNERSVERYRELSNCPGHVTAVLSMMANWDLEPLFAELGSLRVPFLLLAGSDDRAVPVAQLRAVAARLPNARLSVLRGVGHLLHEEQPSLVARFILDEVDLCGGGCTE